MHALCLAQYGCISLLYLTWLCHTDKTEGTLGRREQEVAVIGTCLKEWAVSFLCNLGIACTQHRGNHIVHVSLHEIAHVALHRIRDGWMLHEDIEDIILLLLVLVDYVDGGIIIGYFHRLYLSGIGRHLDAREELLDLVLDMVDIYITHDDDCLIVRAIPLAVVSTQGFRLAAVDDAHQSDRETVAILVVLIKLWQRALYHALLTHDAHTVLIVYHVALVIDGFLGKRDTVAPILEDEHA